MPKKSLAITVLTSSTLGDKYAECIPRFIQSWMKLAKDSGYSFDPHVIIIGNAIPLELVPFSQYLSLESDHGFSAGFVAQNIRNFAGQNFKSDFVVTTDVDMVPLNLRVFKGAINQTISTNSQISILRDVLPAGQFPICYTLATPSAWRKLCSGFGNNTFEFLNNLSKAYINDTEIREYSHGGGGWYTDQEFLYSNIVRNFSESEILRLKDQATHHRRLDRNRNFIYRYIFPILCVPLGLYSDFHLPLPLSHNRRYLRYVDFLQNVNLFFHRIGWRNG